MLYKLVTEYFKHKDAFINDKTSSNLTDRLDLQAAFHQAEQNLREAITPSQPVVASDGEGSSDSQTLGYMKAVRDS